MNSNRLSINRIFLSGHSKSKETISIDEIMGWLLNISFALLFVFIIASYLFKSELKKELEKTKGQLNYYQSKLEDINDETVSQFDEREKVLVELQRQKLLQALDEIEDQDRKKSGLSIFSSATEDGNVEFKINGILFGDKISDNALVKEHFIDGSKWADQKFSYVEDLNKNWLDRVLVSTKTHLKDKHEKVFIVKNSETITEQNEDWLTEEIKKRTDFFHTNFCNFQGKVVTQLFKYYVDDLKRLKGTTVGNFLDKRNFLNASAEMKVMILEQAEDQIYDLAKSTLREQGVLLLSGVED